MNNTSDSALETDYQHAGFGGSLGQGKKHVLLIVDVVAAYLDKNSPLYAGATAEAAFRANQRLATAARKAGIPVIFTNVIYDTQGLTGGRFFQKVPALKAFIGTADAGKFWPGLEPEPTDLIISKHYPSAFFGTSLAPMLNTQAIDGVFITGYSTSGCVRATALDALCHGFIPLVIREACADRDNAPHEANLFDIAAKIGEVISEQTALDIMRNA